MRELVANVLRGCWYVVAIGDEIKTGRMIARRLAGEPIVIARGHDCGIFALRDTCPHRGVPLHYGQVVDNTVACSYHGWRFKADGVCVEIPCLYEGQKIEISKIRCRVYQAIERYGLIWVYLPVADESPADGQMPEPPDLPGIAFGTAPQLHIQMDFPSSIDHSVLALMDLTHAPYVHKLWWFKKDPTKLRLKEKVFEPAPFGFKMKRHKVPPQNVMYHRLLGDNTWTEIYYKLPGFRIEQIKSDKNWAVALTAHTPLEMDFTVVYQCFWSSLSWLAPFAPVARYLARTFLGQDRDYVVLQREGLKSNPNIMLINDADTQARWWLRLKDEWDNAQAARKPFHNPLREQTLRWRS
jgi:phenylpropionate dioxygenase-like ring-hydroxylating dioxygenase large terminal subunit